MSIPMTPSFFDSSNGFDGLLIHRLDPKLGPTLRTVPDTRVRDLFQLWCCTDIVRLSFYQFPFSKMVKEQPGIDLKPKEQTFYSHHCQGWSILPIFLIYWIIRILDTSLWVVYHQWDVYKWWNIHNDILSTVYLLLFTPLILFFVFSYSPVVCWLSRHPWTFWEHPLNVSTGLCERPHDWRKLRLLP